MGKNQRIKMKMKWVEQSNRAPASKGDWSRYRVFSFWWGEKGNFFFVKMGVAFLAKETKILKGKLF